MRRILFFERLEERLAFTPVAFCGLPTGMDVNGDGYITPADALEVISDLNSVADGSYPIGSFDVNCDGKNTPYDVLLIINHLNRYGSTSSIFPVQDWTFFQSFVQAGKELHLGSIGYSSLGKREVEITISIFITLNNQNSYSYNSDGFSNIRIMDGPNILSGPVQISGSPNILWIGEYKGKVSGRGELRVFGDLSESFAGSFKVSCIRSIWDYKENRIQSSVVSTSWIKIMD